MSARDDAMVPDSPEPTEASRQEVDGPLPGRWRILGFLGVAQLMLILDVTVVAIALPHIETDLGLGRETLTWTVSAYTLTFGGLMLLGGRLVDLFGGKPLVLVGLVLFSAASLVTGLADTGAFLILMATALMIAVFFLGTFYFQHARGYSALRTGLLFLPVAVATMIGAQLTGRVLGRVGGRVPAVAGLVLAAGGMVMPVITLNPATVTLGVTVTALGTGALFVIASATALGQVAPHEAGIASGVVSTFHEFGASLGAAVTSTVAVASLTGATLNGYTDGFALAAVASVVAALLTPGRTPEPATAE